MTLPSIRLVTGTLVVFGVLAAVAGLSNALFTDTVTINNSTFATGTAELKIAPNAVNPTGTYVDVIPGAAVTGLVPGEDDDSFKFWLRNASDGDLVLSGAAILNDISGDLDVQENLLIGFTCTVDGVTTTVLQKSLDDWEADETPDPDMGTLTPDGSGDIGTGTDEAYCTMNASLDSHAETPLASAQFDVQITGTQVLPE